VAEPLVIDANPIISALLGGSARRIVFSQKFSFYSTQFTLFEAEKYVPWLAERLDRAERDILREFELLPIIACQPIEYQSQVAAADSLIGSRDSNDVPILALTLELGYPLWTEDRDFDGIPGISVRRTADLLAML
jgi:predicted nucleic acid-binding protein